MLKKTALVIAPLCLALIEVNCAKPATQSIKAGLEYVAPEDVGWSSKKLDEARAFAEKINSAAVMPVAAKCNLFWII